MLRKVVSIKPITLILILLTFIGCSSGGELPVVPVDSHEAGTPERSKEIQRALWGVWSLKFNRDTFSIDAVPLRNPEIHFNITDFLTPPACDDCLSIEVIKFQPVNHFLRVKASLRNPTPLTGYDVRGIILTESAGFRLLNADSYTDTWDDGGDITINPFKAFATDQENREFAPGTGHARIYDIKFVNIADLANLVIVIDASWPGNCKEPYEITSFSQVNDIPADGGSAEISMDVYDWQFDVNQVVIYASPIGGGFVELNYDQGYTWGGTIETTEVNPPGYHRILARATSEGTPVELYNYVNVNIVACTEEGNENWESASVLQVGSDSDVQKVCAVDEYDWYKFDVLAYLYGEFRLTMLNNTGQTKLSLYSDPEAAPLAEVTAAFGSDGVIDADAFELDEGTYYISVQFIGSDIEVRDYVLYSNTTDSICFPEGNDSYGDAIDIPYMHNTDKQYVCLDDKQDWFQFIYDGQEGRKIKLAVLNGTGPADLTLYSETQAPNPEGPNLAFVEADPSEFIHLDPLALDNGTYYLRVRHVGVDLAYREYRIYNYGSDIPCEPEGNETWETATDMPISGESGIQVVCIDDEYDWYTFVAEKSFVGSITLSMMNDTGPCSVSLFGDPLAAPIQTETAEFGIDGVIDLEPLGLEAGIYFLRVAHIGGDLYIRQYSLANEAIIIPFKPEGNETWETATVLNMGDDSGEQGICIFDELDWYKFNPQGPIFGDITLEMTNDTGAADFAFYDNPSGAPIFEQEITYGNDVVLDVESIEFNYDWYVYIRIRYIGSDYLGREYILYNNAAPWPCEPEGNEDWGNATTLLMGNSTGAQEVCKYDIADWYTFWFPDYLIGNLHLDMLNGTGECGVGVYSDPDMAPLLYEVAVTDEDIILDMSTIGLYNQNAYIKISFIGNDYETRDYNLHNMGSFAECDDDGNNSYLTAVDIPSGEFVGPEYLCPPDQEDWFVISYNGGDEAIIKLQVDAGSGTADITLYSEAQAPTPSGPNLANEEADPIAYIDLSLLGLSSGTYYIRARFIGSDEGVREYYVNYINLNSGYVLTWGGTNAGARAIDVEIDDDGGIYVVGNIYNNADLDPGPGVDEHLADHYDSYLSKFNQQGEYLWGYHWGASTSDYETVNDITLDDSGDIYLAGTFGGTVDFDPGPGPVPVTAEGATDAYVSKFDSDGNFLWVQTWGGYHPDNAYGVAVDSAGDIYITGEFAAYVDFDPGPGEEIHGPGNNYFDVFLNKFNSSGQWQWVRVWGGPGNDAGHSIAASSSGGVYVVGDFKGTVDFDPGTGIDERISLGEEDMFVCTYSTSGDYISALTWGSDDRDNCNAVVTDAFGNFYVAGRFSGTADLDPGPGVDEYISNGYSDAFIAKFNSSGQMVWTDVWGGTDFDAVLNFTLDDAGTIYTTGYFQDSVDFDPGPGSEVRVAFNSSDAFLNTLDNDGNFLMSRAWGGTDGDSGYCVAIDTGGKIYVGGYFSDTVDFDPGPELDYRSAGNYPDAYLLKFLSNGSW